MHAQVDRGFKRETVVLVSLDESSGIAGSHACIECGGDGDWTKFHPEPTERISCVECKGTGVTWVGL